VGVTPYDDIMIAVDYGHSWRKKFAEEYKGNRKTARETHEYINWDEKYKEMNDLLDKLEIGTSWQVLKENSLEADDWMSGVSRFFPDREVVLVTYDSDMEQLTKFSNVKIFSPKTKEYKIVDDPYLSLSKKIEIERTDNLTNPLLNNADYIARKTVVNLMELPDFIQCKIDAKLKSLQPKDENIEEIPYEPMRERYGRLYNDTSKIVTYESSVRRLERKAKFKIKKAALRRKQKVKKDV